MDTLGGVTAIRIRQRLRRLRGRSPGIAVVLVLAAVVFMHHGSAMDETGQHDGMGAALVMQVCVAAMVALGASVVAVAIGLIPLRRWRPVDRRLPRPRFIACDIARAQARAGPANLFRICVLRR